MIKEVIKAPADRSSDNDFFIDPRPRPRFIQLIDLLNNFFVGFLVGSFLWAFPFIELAGMIGDAIALHCGAK